MSIVIDATGRWAKIQAEHKAEKRGTIYIRSMLEIINRVGDELVGESRTYAGILHDQVEHQVTFASSRHDAAHLGHESHSDYILYWILEEGNPEPASREAIGFVLVGPASMESRMGDTDYACCFNKVDMFSDTA